MFRYLRFLLAFITVFAFTPANGQFFNWVHPFKSPLPLGGATTVSPTGSIWMGGEFDDSLVTGIGLNRQVVYGGNTSENYLAKYTSQGTLLSLQHFGGDTDSHIHYMITDDSGNVYLGGYMEGLTDFDPNPANTMVTLNRRTGYVMKLDSTGNLIWWDTIAASIQTTALLLHHQRLYTIGVGSQGFYLENRGLNGTLNWTQYFAQGTPGGVLGIAVDTNGYITLTGDFSQTADFDPGPGSALLNPGGTLSSDVFILQLDSLGDFRWVRSIGGPGRIYARAMAADAEGNIYLADYYRDSINFDMDGGPYWLNSPGNESSYVCKLDTAGKFQWAFDVQAYGAAYAVAYFNNHRIAICGQFEGTADFDPGPGTVPGTAISRGAYILEVDSAANFQSVIVYPDNSGSIFTADLTYGPSGEMVFAGLFQGPIDFDPNGGTTILTHTGPWDAYVCRFSDIPTQITEGSQLEFDIAVYPNPATNQFSVEAPPMNQGSLSITNAHGAEVFAQALPADGNISISTTSWPVGIYWIKISDNQKTMVRKLIVGH